MEREVLSTRRQKFSIGRYGAGQLKEAAEIDKILSAGDDSAFVSGELRADANAASGGKWGNE